MHDARTKPICGNVLKPSVYDCSPSLLCDHTRFTTHFGSAMTSTLRCNSFKLQLPNHKRGPRSSLRHHRTTHSFERVSDLLGCGTSHAHIATRRRSFSSVVVKCSASVLAFDDLGSSRLPIERTTPPKLPPTPSSSRLLDVLPYLVKLAVSDR